MFSKLHGQAMAKISSHFDITFFKAEKSQKLPCLFCTLQFDQTLLSEDIIIIAKIFYVSICIYCFQFLPYYSLIHFVGFSYWGHFRDMWHCDIVTHPLHLVSTFAIHQTHVCDIARFKWGARRTSIKASYCLHTWILIW